MDSKWKISFLKSSSFFSIILYPISPNSLSLPGLSRRPSSRNIEKRDKNQESVQLNDRPLPIVAGYKTVKEIGLDGSSIHIYSGENEASSSDPVVIKFANTNLDLLENEANIYEKISKEFFEFFCQILIPVPKE